MKYLFNGVPIMRYSNSFATFNQERSEWAAIFDEAYAGCSESLMKLSENFLNTSVPVAVKRKYYFEKWLPNCDEFYMNRLEQMFTDEMIAFELLVRAAKCGCKEAFIKIGERYSCGKFPIQNMEVANACFKQGRQ